MVDNPRIEDLRRRVQLDPASIAFAALAEEYRRAGRIDDAIATCVTGLKRHPSYLSARVTLGRALMDAGRIEEARAELEGVLRAAPDNLAALRGLAEMHQRREEAATPNLPNSAQPRTPKLAEPLEIHALPSEPPPEDPQVMALEAFLAAVRFARDSHAGRTA